MSARVLAALLALAAVAGGGARAEDAKATARVRVALDRLRAGGISPALTQAVEERVCAALSERPGLEVVCPADVAAAALFARNAALLGECATDECLQRVERAKAADRRVTGALERGEKGVVLSLQVTGPEGPGPRVVERLPEDLDAILAKVPAAVKRLFP